MAIDTVQYKCVSECLLESILLSKVTLDIIIIIIIIIICFGQSVFTKKILLKIVYSNGFDVDF